MSFTERSFSKLNMKPIKICHFTSVHSSDDARVFHKMCVSASKAGYDTYLVAPGKSFISKGIKVIGVGERPESRVRRMLSFARNVYAKARELDADIYHFHDPELLFYGLKLKRLGKRVIYDCHEDYTRTILDSQWMPAFLRGIAARIYAFVEKRVCSKLDAVICVNPHLQARFLKYGANTLIITNYPIIDDDTEYSEEYAGNRVLCFAGGIAPKWLHENVISILRDCDAQYLLAGVPSEEYLEKLKSLDGWQNVIYKGLLPHEEVPALLRESAVGMALHDYTASMQGNVGTIGVTKLFEYMLSALPVICTDFTSWKEIIEPEQCGICVNPTNLSEIASAVRYILADPERAARMGQNGRRAVLEKYNWQTQEVKLLRLYRALSEPDMDRDFSQGQ